MDNIMTILQRLNDLERRIRTIESWHNVKPKTNELIGIEGLERQYSKVFADVGFGVHKEAARYFFLSLNHNERVRVLLKAEVITEYISNDPVYYTDVLNVIKHDHDKARKVLQIIVDLVENKEETADIEYTDYGFIAKFAEVQPGDPVFVKYIKEDEPSASDWKEVAIEAMEKLSPDDRLLVMGGYCSHCGDKDPRHLCQCWNDE